MFIKRLTHSFSITSESLRLCSNSLLVSFCAFLLSLSFSLALSLFLIITYHWLDIWLVSICHCAICHWSAASPIVFPLLPASPLQAGTMAVWVGSRLRLSCSAAGKPASWWETANQELASTPSLWSECTDVWTWSSLSVYMPAERPYTLCSVECVYLFCMLFHSFHVIFLW